MEQTNLVVTPDGKTWDEVTRDVSYIGDVVLNSSTDTATTWATVNILDEWRGIGSGAMQMFNKDWAIAYNRIICLKEGWYKFTKMLSRSDSAGTHSIYIINEDDNMAQGEVSAGSQSSTIVGVHFCKRGEGVAFYGETSSHNNGNNYIVERI
jgi:hypothetical protein